MLINDLKAKLDVPIFFHSHNDLGMATANSLSAIKAGAEGVDVTINGLGDRAGNCSLEQLAIILSLQQIETGIHLDQLLELAKTVANESGIPIYPLAPVVGSLVFSHRSPAHFEIPELFEAFDPQSVGRKRSLIQ